MSTLNNSIKGFFSAKEPKVFPDFKSDLNTEKYEDLNYYYNLFIEKKNIAEYELTEGIHIFNEFELDTDISTVLKKVSKGFYIFHKTSFGTKILFFEKTILKEKAKCEYHFLYNKLFYVSFNFPLIDNSSRNEFIQKLIFANTKFKISKTDIIFKDPSNNLMIVKDSLVLNVSFINKKFVVNSIKPAI
jgi:hypothetical protein